MELIICDRCGSDACLSLTNQNKHCLGCGFTTVIDEITKNNLPELYKEICFEKDGEIWYPSVINIPNKGMVFVDGSSKEEWKWSAIKAIKVEDEYKMDMNTITNYDHKDYMDALFYINYFDKEI